MKRCNEVRMMEVLRDGGGCEKEPRGTRELQLGAAQRLSLPAEEREVRCKAWESRWYVVLCTKYMIGETDETDEYLMYT